MPSVTCTIGIPGCGKSTWAREFVKKNGTTVVVCRDDIRAQLFGGIEGYKHRNPTEALVTAIAESNAKTALDMGRNVIIADTCCKVKTLQYWKAFAKANQATFAVKDFMQMYLDANPQRVADLGPIHALKGMLKRSHEWNLIRPNSVPPEAIDRMFQNYITEIRGYKVKQYTGTPGKPKAVLLDLDGTLCHMVNRGPFDWDKVGQDTIDPHVYEAVCLYKAAGYKILAVSGRDAVCRNATRSHLNTACVPYEDLWMRKEGDQRPDDIVKEEIFWDDIAPNYDVRLALDDRQRVVEQYRSMGIKVFQVAPGDF